MFGFYRVAGAIPELKVADVKFNAEKMSQLAREAAANQVALLVFPELALTGKSCGDWFRNPTLAQAAWEELKGLTQNLPSQLVCVISLPLYHNGELYRAATVCGAKKIYGVVIADSPSEVFSANEFPFENIERDGMSIPCGKNLIFSAAETEFYFSVNFADDQAVKVGKSGGALQVVIGGESARIGAAAWQKKSLEVKSGDSGAAVLFVGAGAHESTTRGVYAGRVLGIESGKTLLDDGAFNRESTIYSVDFDLDFTAREMAKQGVRVENRRWINVPQPHDTDDLQRDISPAPFIPNDKEELRSNCTETLAIQSAGLAKRVEHTNAKKLVMGISGGLDSTLALLMCARALKSLKRPMSDLVAITMPGFGTTGRTKSNAAKLSEIIGAELREIDIRPACMEHFREIGHDENQRDTVYENAQARERTQILMDLANGLGGIVVGTGDLSESALGWCTFNGDHISLYSVNSTVPKTFIPELLREESKNYSEEVKEILEDIIATPVSPELLPPDSDGKIAQKTEELIGAYEIHDFYIYHYLRRGATPPKLLFLADKAFKGKYDHAELLRVLIVFIKRFISQQFKRNCAADGPVTGSVSLSVADFSAPSDAMATAWLDSIK